MCGQGALQSTIALPPDTPQNRVNHTLTSFCVSVISRKPAMEISESAAYLPRQPLLSS